MPAGNGIRDYCLVTTEFFAYQTDFQFICHHTHRDENLVHSLQCLRDTRVLATLYFHIARRCRGTGILDTIMRRYKNAHFYAMGVTPGRKQPIVPDLYCLSNFVISTCIRDIVEDHCGIVAAALAENYILYLQDWFGQVMETAGLHSNICDHDIGPDMVPNRPSILSGHSKLGISRLSEMAAPGTALDTVWGKMLQTYLHGLSGEQLCTTDNAVAAYFVCVLSSHDKSEMTQFNILQFAHQTIPIIYHGTRCSRLNEFTECWNLLQNICGLKNTGIGTTCHSFGGRLQDQI